MLKVTGGKWKPPEHFKTKYILKKKKKNLRLSIIFTTAKCYKAQTWQL